MLFQTILNIIKKLAGIRLFLVLIVLAIGPGQANGQNTRLWATYYGGINTEYGYSIATDASGNIYVAGLTDSPTAIASGGFQNTYGGGFYDAFLVKFDGNGNRLWATYYGGADVDYGFYVATDVSGNVYLAGLTSSTSGIASGGFQNTYGGGTNDAFLVKFDGNGNRLWATYYGGTSLEYGYSISADASGNVYLSGFTGSASGIASGGFQNVKSGGGDAFLVKFDGAGNRLWATYYGGAGDDYGLAIATDASGNQYMAGYTVSASNIASGGFQNAYGGGGGDAFLVKFDGAGNRLWATYYGGAGSDGGYSVATDAAGNVYLTGTTDSNLGIASGGFQNSQGGSDDAFLVKFDGAGNRLWATYYGGTGNEEIGSVSTDVFGNVYLSGDTYSNSSIASGGFQNSLIGIEDEFVAKFDSSGNRLCATYYGQDHDEDGHAAVDGNGNVYLAGSAKSSTGIASGGFQNTFAGVHDAYLVKFTTCCTLAATVSGTTSICAGQNSTLSASGGTNYSWNTGEITSSIVVSPTASTSYSVIVSDGNCSTTALINVAVHSVNAMLACPTDPCYGASYTLTAQGGNAYLWNTGATGSSIAAVTTTTTTYSVMVTDSISGCSNIVSCTLAPPPDAAINGAGTICAGNSLLLTSSSAQGYSWSTGSNSSSITVNPAISTTYSVVVVNGFCWDTALAFVTVLPSPAASISGSTSICQGNSVSLTASGGGTYTWNTGATIATITDNPVSTTSYTVTVANANGCTAIATTTVSVVSSPVVSVSGDSAICLGESTVLTASGGTTYSWSNGSVTDSIVISPSVHTTYSVAVTNACGSKTALITVYVEENSCQCFAGEVFIPNAFSPNNDGENEKECVMGNCIQTLYFAIYNRWGEKVFETTDPKICWDGTYDGKPLSTAVFLYYVEATLIGNGEFIHKKGNISLIR